VNRDGHGQDYPVLIKNATIVTWEEPNRIIPDYALRIEGGVIAEIAPSADLERKHPSLEALDVGGQLVLPGNICAHTHFYGAFARGMAIPGDAPADFPQILQKLWWPLDRSLTEADVRYSSLLCLADAIRHGTTTLVDHHASPNAIDGSLDVIAEAVTEAGLRAVLCYEVTDRDGEDKMKAGIHENLRFIEKSSANPMLKGTFGLHASLTLSHATLDKCRDSVPSGVGFHVHVAESEADERDSLKKSGVRTAERLHRHGILGPRTIAAHCVHVDEREMQTLAETGTWVSHQPRSNMNNGVGAARVEEMLGKGIRVCLGNDGFSNAMWEEWKTTYLLHKLHYLDPRRMSGDTVVRVAVYNNSVLVSSFFPETPVGVLRPGAAADLMFVEYHAPTPLTAGNLPWHILFGFRDDMVTATMVGGRFLMKDRRMLTLDEAEIAARAKELAAKLWKRYESEF
jgi:putative selenium metabolism protein SsnA